MLLRNQLRLFLLAWDSLVLDPRTKNLKIKGINLEPRCVRIHGKFQRK